MVFIAEKNSVAASLAEIISNNNFKKASSRTPLFLFNTRLFGVNCNVKVSAVAGHLFNRDFPENYNNWERVDPISLFDAITIKKKTNHELSGFLEDLARDADAIVLCLDNDPEGENISFEVLDTCYRAMRK